MSLKIAVLAGGNSSEFEISMNSAEQVMQNLDRDLYQPFKIVIKGPDWNYVPEDGSPPVAIDKNDFTLTLDGEKIGFDAVFIAIHGTPGEDGKIQAYLEMLNIPFTSCSSDVSSLTFHKYACKAYLESLGILTPRALFTRTSHSEEEIKSAGLEFPLFIKANNSGSSYGVTFVRSAEQLNKAFLNARSEGDEILIEEAVMGTEVTCGLFRSGDDLVIFPPTEIVSHNEYFDYEAKYTPGAADEITPARLADIQLKKIQNESAKIYNLLGCSGIVRIDFILKNGNLYFLEINTIPGLSRESIVPKQAATYGMDMKQLFTALLQEVTPRN